MTVYIDGMILGNYSSNALYANLDINYCGNANWAFDNPNFLIRLLNAPLVTTPLIEDCVPRTCKLVNIRLL